MNAYEIAKEVGVCYSTIYKWVEKGCPNTKKEKGLTTVMEFDLEEVLAWIQEQKRLNRK